MKKDIVQIDMITGISESEAEKRYAEFLDEAFGIVDIAGMFYSTGRLLKSVDPIAYRCGMLEWADAEGLEVM